LFSVFVYDQNKIGREYTLIICSSLFLPKCWYFSDSIHSSLVSHC